MTDKEHSTRVAIIGGGCAALGDTESAVAALQRAAENREAELIYLNVRPVYAPLREDARVKALLARVGLDRATRTD